MNQREIRELRRRVRRVVPRRMARVDFCAIAGVEPPAPDRYPEWDKEEGWDEGLRE